MVSPTTITRLLLGRKLLKNIFNANLIALYNYIQQLYDKQNVTYFTDVKLGGTTSDLDELIKYTSVIPFSAVLRVSLE